MGLTEIKPKKKNCLHAAAPLGSSWTTENSCPERTMGIWSFQPLKEAARNTFWPQSESHSKKKWWSNEGNTWKYYIFTRWLSDHFWPHYIFTQYCDLKEMILKISMHLISSRIISPVEAQSLSILRMTADRSARWNIDEIDWNRTNLPPKIPCYFNVSM